jgi:hypothetical protein
MLVEIECNIAPPRAEGQLARGGRCRDPTRRMQEKFEAEPAAG